MQQWQFINNFNQLNMFRAIVRPSTGALDYVYSLWYNAPTMLPVGDMSTAGSIVSALYHKL